MCCLEPSKEKEISFKRITTLLVGMFGAIVLASTGIVDLFTCLLCLVAAALVLKVAKSREIFNSIDFDLIVVIASRYFFRQSHDKHRDRQAYSRFYFDVGY